MKNIIGHQKQIEQIERSLKEERLAHALLFSGMEGIGKKQIALALAKILLGTEKNPETHPDCHFILPEKNRIKIETIRELKQKLTLHPLEGLAKIAILDDAHLLTLASANALLKILEEPPSQTYFILISSKPSYLLPTIHSRCQRIDFSPLSKKDVEQWLMKKGVEKAEATAKAHYAQGSIGQAIAFSPQTFDTIQNQLETLEKNPKPSRISALCEEWMQDEENLTTVLSVMRHLWRKKIVEADARESAAKWLQDWDRLEEANRALEGYPNKQLLLENLLFNLVSP